MKQRIALLVYVDVDPDLVPKIADKTALDEVGHILDEHYSSWNPLVSHAPDELQPPRTLARISASQEIPKPETYLPVPVAGTSPSHVGVLTTADLAMTYNAEGNVEA